MKLANGSLACLCVGSLTVFLCLVIPHREIHADRVPFLFKDFNPQPLTKDTILSKTDGAVVGDCCVFCGPNGEFWRTDGTTENTGILLDLYSTGEANPREFSSVSGRSLFKANTFNGILLWKSDGTAEGTFPIVFPQTALAYSYDTIGGDGTVVMSAYDFGRGLEIWRVSAGSVEASFVKDIYPGGRQSGSAWDPYSSIQSRVHSTGGVVVFIANNGSGGSAIWCSDGTENGTKILKDLGVGAAVATSIQSLKAQGKVYFRLAMKSGNVYSPSEVWVTDGTTGGTMAVKIPVTTSNECALLSVMGEKLLFNVISQHVNKLFITDGTTTEARFLGDFVYRSSDIPDTCVTGGYCYFWANTQAEGTELWRTNGTMEGTELVADLNPGTGNGAYPELIADWRGPFAGGDGWVYFTGTNDGATKGVWRTNGTAADTVKLFNGHLSNLINFKEHTLLFAKNALYSVDNQTGGLATLKNYSFQTNKSSTPFFVKKINDKMIIKATPPNETNPMVYSINGTADETERLDINIGHGHLRRGVPTDYLYIPEEREQYFIEPPEYVGRAYFEGYIWDEAAGSSQYGICRTDGTNVGTEVVVPNNVTINGVNMHSMPRWPVMHNNSLYYFNFIYYLENGNPYTQHALGIFRYDPATGETVKLLDLGSEFNPITYYSYGFSKVSGDNIYYYLSRIVSNRYQIDLYAYNIPANTMTRLFTEPKPSINLLMPHSMGDKLYFVNVKDPSQYNNRPETHVYATNGTVSGTLRLTNYQIPAFYSGYLPESNDIIIPYWGPGYFTQFKDKVYFSDCDSSKGYEVYQSDGSANGTRLLKDIGPGAEGGMTRYLTVCNNSLFMLACQTPTGAELWKSDGTEAGTVMVKDIFPGPASSEPREMLNVDDTLYFAANDGIHGMELWKSDGTSGGTVLISDIVPGPASSSPNSLFLLNGRLYFNATHPDTGEELWALELPLLAPANPSGVPVGPTAIRWNWEDATTEESGFRVWCDPGTAAPVTLRATLPADTAAWVQNGLAANTPYTFQVAAFDGEGESRRTAPVTVWTHIEPVAALEYPEITPRSITLRAAAPVPSNLDQGGSGLRFANLSQGVYSDWTRDNTKGWTSTGLNPDTPHAFWARSRNGAGAVSTPAMDVKWTAAETPGAPLLSAVTPHGMTASLPADGNPAHTWYALRVTPPAAGRSWVQADGSLGASPFYMQRSGWSPVGVTGLPDGITHTLRFIAQNGEGLNTPFGPGTTATTPDVTPPVAEITLPDPNPINADRLRFVVRFSEPVGGSFDASDITLSGNLAGSVASSGMDPDYLVEVALEPGAEQGFLGITITGSVADLEGNPLGGAASPQYEVLRWAGFTAHPQGARLYAGQSHTLSAAVAPDQLPVAWQWRRMAPDGAAGNGPAAAQWVLNNAAPEDSAVYWCEAGKNGNTHPSRTATVTVAQHLRITVQPRDALALTGTAHTLSVETEGGHAPLRYQWRKNEGNIPGANGRELVLSPLELGDGGLYAVEVTDDLTDSVLSDAALLTVEKAMPAPSGAAALALAALLVALAGANRARGKKLP